MSDDILLHDPKVFGKVALLLGGWSAEREISLKSGAAVYQALSDAQVEVHAVDAGKDIVSVLTNGRFDRVFNILHGRGGEDGVIQSVLELMGIPYTGSGVLASALSMDKLRTKWVWQGLQLPTPPFLVLRSEEDCVQAVAQLGLPLAVKPTLEGSSIGISKVEKAEDVIPAWHGARKYGCTIAESWIAGSEYTVSILQGRALPAIRLETPRAFYDYEAKYFDDKTRYYCPSGLDEVNEAQVKALALHAFKAVGAKGWGRVDLMIDRQGMPWLIEVNTVPGMTDHSLVPMAARQQGMTFAELCLQVLATSCEVGNEY